MNMENDSLWNWWIAIYAMGANRPLNIGSILFFFAPLDVNEGIESHTIIWSSLFSKLDQKDLMGTNLLFTLFLSLLFTRSPKRKMGNIGEYLLLLLVLHWPLWDKNNSFILILFAATVGKPVSRSIAWPNSGMTDYFEDFDDDASDTHHKVYKQRVDVLQI